MTTVLLVRHGLTPLTGPVLAGWSPGVHLDERGRETAAAILAGREPAPPLHVDEQVGEVRYGAWTGRELRALRKEPLWAVVQGHPSAAVFPDGEGLAEMSARAVAAARRWNAALGPDATYAVVSHGDVIKAILADALGLHLDGFQRIGVDPCALSVVRYAATGTQVERVNDTGGSVAALAPSGRAGRTRARTRAARGAAR